MFYQQNELARGFIYLIINTIIVCEDHKLNLQSGFDRAGEKKVNLYEPVRVIRAAQGVGRYTPL